MSDFYGGGGTNTSNAPNPPLHFYPCPFKLLFSYILMCKSFMKEMRVQTALVLGKTLIQHSIQVCSAHQISDRKISKYIQKYPLH